LAIGFWPLAFDGTFDDDRLLESAQAALRGRAVPFRATLFAKSSQANWLIPWHQDTALPLRSRFEDPHSVSWSPKDGVLYAHAPEWLDLGPGIQLAVA
jgi:hypothetical protein